MKRILTLILTLAMLFTFASFPMPIHAASGTVTVYPEYPEDLPRDYDYEVTVSGANGSFTIPVYNSSRNKNAYHSTENTDSWRRFCEFSFTGEVEISIRVKIPMASYALLPSSKNYQSSFSGNTIKFKLTQPQDLLLRLNEDNNTVLSIFAQAPETDVPAKDDPDVLYFDKGLNNLVNGTFSPNEYGMITLNEGQSVYLAPGALVTARFFSKRSNIKIYGRGAVLDPRLDRGDSGWSFMFWVKRHNYSSGGVEYFDPKPKNITVKDIKFLDANIFNVCFTNCENVTVENIKILSSAISTDGISTWGDDCKDVTIKDNYIYVNDNAFVFSSGENLNVTNCTVGTGHAIIHPQGELKSTSFDGLDIFESGDFFRAYETMSKDVVWNITAKNINASDAKSISALVRVRDSKAGAKNVTFENVALPANTPVVFVQNTSNMKVTLNNVYLGSTPLTSTSQFKGYLDYGTGVALTQNTFKIGYDFDMDKAGVGTHANALKSAYYSGDETIQIGSYTLPLSKNTVVNSGGVTYVNAVSVLDELYYNPKFNGTTLTFDGSSAYSIPLKIIGGEAMLPIDFFSDVLNHNVSYQNGVVKISPRDVSNVLKDAGFENTDNPYLPNGINPLFSRHWTYMNFCGAYEEKSDVYEGSTALRLETDDSSQMRALAQYITPVIQKYGAGTYRIEAWVKKGASCAASEMFMGIAHSGYQVTNGDGINDVKTFTLTNSWQKISYDVVIDDISKDGYDRAFLAMGIQKVSGGGTTQILIDNVSLSYKNKLIVYPEYPEEMARDYDFTVTVKQGEKSFEIPVYNAARQRSSFSTAGDNFRRFSEFSFEGAVTVEVDCRFGCGYFEVLPASKGVKSTKKDGVVSFTITEPGNYYVRMNKDNNVALAIFADPVETEVPDKNDPNVIYFEAGLNNSSDYVLDQFGRLRVNDNQTVYLAPGALVMARTYVRGSNTKVMGRGAFMDPRMDRIGDWTFMAGISDNRTAESTIYNNVTVKDVKFLDSHSFNFSIRGVDGLHLDNIKILSNQISTDGISAWGTSTAPVKNVVLENSFIYNSDDMNVLSNVQNMTVRNCVYGTGYRFVIPQNAIGTLLFEDIDIFKLETFLRANSSGEAAKWDSVTFRNVNVEAATEGMNYFLRIQNGTSDTKNITFENVVLPKKFTSGVYVASGQNINLTFNNVYVGSTLLTSSNGASLFGNFSVGNNNVIYSSGNASEAGVGDYTSIVGAKDWKGSMRVVVGEKLTLAPAKITPYTFEETLYLSAPDTLEALGYSSKLSGGIFTFTKGNSYTVNTTQNALYKNGVKIGDAKLQLVDGYPMVSTSLFESLGYTVDTTSTANRIKILTDYKGDNLIHESDFEENKNPFVLSKTENQDRFYSHAWNAFNFGQLRSSDDSYTGFRSLHLSQTEHRDAGVAQSVAHALYKYGKTVYNITFYAKLGEYSNYTKDIFVGFVQGGYRVREGETVLSPNLLKRVTLTNEWQKISVDVEMTDEAMAVASNMYLYIGSTATTFASNAITFDCFIDDVSLTVVTPITQSELANTLNKTHTRDGAVQKGWANGNGVVQKPHSTFSGTIYVHPEFEPIYEDMNGEIMGENYINGLYMEGAQVRIGDGETTGLRFVTANNTDMSAKLQKVGINASYGTLVSISSNVNGEMTLGQPKVFNSAANQVYKTNTELGTDYSKYTACVINIDKSNFKTDITVRPYITYTDLSGITRIFYGEQYTLNLYDAATMAYNSSAESQNTKNLIYSEILSKVN